MTLILSLVTQDFVVQASDRMVTYIETGDVKNSNANKMVLLENRMVFGYSGLATLEGRDTDEWLTSVLMSPSIRSVSDATALIAGRATQAMAKINRPAAIKRLAFVGAGWVRRDQDDRFHPIICRISNFHGQDIQGRGTADDKFSLGLNIYKPPGQTWGWLEVGADLAPHRQKWLDKQMKRCAERGVGPRAVVQLFAEIIQQVSRENVRVGDDVLIGMIPRGAADFDPIGLLNPDWGGGVVVGAKTPEEFGEALKPGRAMNFLFIHGATGRIEAYGPRIASPTHGVMVGGVEIKPVT